MRHIVGSCLLSSLTLLTSPELRAQEKEQGQEKQGKGAVDPTKAAAEALRRLLERAKAQQETQQKPGETRPGESVLPVPHKVWEVKPDPNRPTPPPTDPPSKDPPSKDPPSKDPPAQGPPARAEPKPTPPAQQPDGPRAGRDDPEQVMRRRREAQARAEQQAAERALQVSKPPQDSAATGGPSAPEPLPWSGRFSLAQRYRRSPSREKQETIGLLALDLGRSRLPGYSAHLLARATLDTSSRNGDGGLGGLAQTYDSRGSAQLYEAHVDLHQQGGLQDLRLGRQTLHDLPEYLLLDGVSLSTEPLGASRLQFGGHVGLPAQIFESSPRGDFAGGVFAQTRPWRGGRIRLDYQHIDDERLFSSHHNDLVGLTIAQGHGGHSVWGRLTQLDSRLRDLRLRGSTTFCDERLRLRVHYDELLETQAALAVSFDPLSDALLEYHPYRQLGITLDYEPSPALNWIFDLSARRLARSRDAGAFNRDFERAALALHWIPLRDHALHFSVDAYESDGRDSTAISAEYISEFSSSTELGLGSLFSLYKYDFISQQERDRVRTWFVRLEQQLAADWELRVDYAFETGPFPDTHRAEARLTWTF